VQLAAKCADKNLSKKLEQAKDKQQKPRPTMAEVKKECAVGKALTQRLIALNKEFKNKKKTGKENPAKIAKISQQINKCVSRNYSKYLFKMSYAELRNHAYRQFAKNPTVHFLLHNINVDGPAANHENGGTQQNSEQRQIIGTNGKKEFYHMFTGKKSGFLQSANNFENVYFTKYLMQS
jgi:hypothetical protein